MEKKTSQQRHERIKYAIRNTIEMVKCTFALCKTPLWLDFWYKINVASRIQNVL